MTTNYSNRERLKDAVSVQFGQPPDDVFLKSPTPWGDLYTTYGWKEVTVTTKPISSVVVSKEFRNQTVAKQKYTNKTSSNATLWGNMSRSVDEVTINWYNPKKISINGNVSHHFDFTQIGGKDFHLTVPWRIDTEELNPIKIGSEIRFKDKLKTNEALEVEVRTIKANIKIEVVYESTLSGNVVLNYKNKLMGHHFWAVEVADVLSIIGTRPLITKEVIEMEFYTKTEQKLKVIQL
ncbi:unnamed protein product [Pieris macdunnoughi]|uniref:Uncharacterized protein n=1 Tax=Pieris macdunnoughi TaxID=345717 RepID=A0A821XFW6_9NEOP|nr:unnamed protein product [Pieris macdunnoughi]